MYVDDVRELRTTIEDLSRLVLKGRQVRIDASNTHSLKLESATLTTPSPGKVVRTIEILFATHQQ